MQTLSNGIWQNIRLELAPTAEFPEGSASRAYMLRLPVRADGTIDEQAVEVNAVMARFRRFWPNEPDRSGRIIRKGNGWALSLQPKSDDGDVVFPIELDRLSPGEQVEIGKHGGGRWRFRVVDLQIDAPGRS